MLFGIPIGWLSAMGIAISFVSFMVFTYAKTLKQQKHQQTEGITSKLPSPSPTPPKPRPL
jgi:hypothetical protein